MVWWSRSERSVGDQVVICSRAGGVKRGNQDSFWRTGGEQAGSGVLNVFQFEDVG